MRSAQSSSLRLFQIVALACLSAVSVALAWFQVRGSLQGPTATFPLATPQSVRSPLPQGTYPIGPLDAGSLLPEMVAAGWINGSPDHSGKSETRLVVLDIWSQWCPGCKMTAPGLVRLQKKYAKRGVSFVSLTEVDQTKVTNFAREAEITWSCGYGASLQSLSQFGAYSAERMNDTYNPGYEVSPTLYVIGADGRVLWHDNQARPRHLKAPDEIVQDLEAEIERLLAIEA